MQANEAVAIVTDCFLRAGLELGGKSRAAVGRFAKSKLEAGESADDVRAWAGHFGERKAQGAKLTPSHAWEDVTGADSPAVMAGVPQTSEKMRERSRIRRHADYEWLADRMSDRQGRMLATVQELTRAGKSTPYIVEAVLGPRPEAP